MTKEAVNIVSPSESVHARGLLRANVSFHGFYSKALTFVIMVPAINIFSVMFIAAQW